MNLLRLASVLLLLTTFPSFSQDNQKLDMRQGRISGVVLNGDGQAMAGVNVCTTVARKDGGMTECRVTTDKSGHFEIDHLSMGTLSVHATQEGYDLRHQQVRSVKLTTEEPSVNITVRLGHKAAILSGTVRDKFSQKGVANFTFISLTDAGEMSTSGSENGEFRLTVSDGTDIVVAVTARGYKSAFYPETLNLQSGEEKSLDIEMEPKPQN